MMKNRKIVIDADSLIYQSCFNTACSVDELPEDEQADEVDLPTSVNEALEESIRAFQAKVNEIVYSVATRYKDIDTEPIIVITVKEGSEKCKHLEPNYRYSVMQGVEDIDVKGYKAKRREQEIPEGLLELYNWVYDQPNTICEGGVEADDVCVYMGSQGHLVCALDKDVIGSLPEAYNYGKKEWTSRTELEIRQFPYLQTIMGDASDGLRGVFKVGIKGAEKAIKNKETDIEMWTAVVTEYFKKGQTLEEAVATMLCVRMDMWTPDDGITYWTPPKKGK